MKLVKLGEVCEIINGSTPSRNNLEFWNGDINWFTPKDLSGLKSKYINESPEKITKEGFKSCSTTLLPINSVLFTSRAPIGHIAINKIECCTNQGFKSLIPKDENVISEYLYYTLKYFTPHLQDLGNGATFKELSKATFEKFQIPLPPLATQKATAEKLDKADALRKKDQELLAQYDDLAQAIFIDMFGDPVQNEKGWEKVLLGELAELSSGSTPSRDNESYFNGDIPWVKTTEVKNEYIFDTLEKISSDALKNSSCKIYPKDSLIIAMYGQGKTRGQVGYLKLNATTNQACCVVQIHKDINNLFVFETFKMLYNDLRDLGRGGNQPNLNVGILKNYKIIVPPLTLQNEFAEKIKNIEAQKALVKQQAEESENLFQALLQESFNFG